MCDLHIFEASLKCEKHNLYGDEVDDWWIPFIKPWWEELKYNMKSDQCICFMLEEGDMYLDRRYLQEASPKSEAHCLSEENSQTVAAIQSCKRHGFLVRVLEEEFYRREGTWQFHYEPGEIWCGECLAEREGFYESSSEDTDTEDSNEDTDVESSNEEGEEHDDASDISMD